MLRFGALTFGGPRDHLREHFHTAREDVPRLSYPTKDVTDEYLGCAGHDRQFCQLDSFPLSDDAFMAALRLACEASQFVSQPAKPKKHWNFKLCSKSAVEAVMSSVQPQPAVRHVSCSNMLTPSSKPGLAQVTFGLQLQWRNFASNLAIPLLEKRISQESSCSLLGIRAEIRANYGSNPGLAADQQLANVPEELAGGLMRLDVSTRERLTSIPWEAEGEFGKVQVPDPEPVGAVEALARAIEPKPVSPAAAAVDILAPSEFGGVAAQLFAAPISDPAGAIGGPSIRTLRRPPKNEATPARAACAMLPSTLMENLLQYRERQQQQYLSDIQLGPDEEFSCHEAASQDRSSRRRGGVSHVLLGCPRVRQLSPGRTTVPEFWIRSLAPPGFVAMERQRTSEGVGRLDGGPNTPAVAVVAEGCRRYQGQGRGQGRKLASPVAMECWDVDERMAREAAAAVEALVGLGCSLNEVSGTAEVASLLAPTQSPGGCLEGCTSAAEVSGSSNCCRSKHEPQQQHHCAAHSVLFLSSSSAADFQRQLQLDPEPLPLPVLRSQLTPTSATSSHREAPGRGPEHCSLGLPVNGEGQCIGLAAGGPATGATLLATRIVSPLVSQLLCDVRRVIRSDPASRLAAATGATAPAARIARAHDDALLVGPLRHSALMAAAITAAARAASCRSSAGVAGTDAEPGRNDAGDLRNGGNTVESAGEGGGDMGPDGVGEVKCLGSGGGCVMASRTEAPQRSPDAFLLELPLQLPYDGPPIVQEIMRAVGKPLRDGAALRWQALVAAAPPPPSLPLPTANTVHLMAADNGNNITRSSRHVAGRSGGGANGRRAIETRRRQPICVEDLIAADLQLTDEADDGANGVGGGGGVGVRTLPVVLLPDYTKGGGGAGISGADPASWAESAPDVLRSAMADLGCQTAATAHLDLYLDWSVLGPAGASRMASGAMIDGRYGGRGGGGSSGSAAASLLRAALYPKPVTLASAQQDSAQRMGSAGLSAAGVSAAAAAAGAAQQHQRLGVTSGPGFAVLTGQCWVQYAGCLACTSDCALWPDAAALRSLRRWQQRLLPLSPDAAVRVGLHEGAADGSEAHEAEPKSGPACMVPGRGLCGGRAVQACRDTTAGGGGGGGGSSSGSGSGGRDRSDFGAAAAAAATAAPAKRGASAPSGGRSIEDTDAGDEATCRSRAGTGGCTVGDVVKRPRGHRVDDWDAERGREATSLATGLAAPASGGSGSNEDDAGLLENSAGGSAALARPLTKRQRTDTASATWNKAAAPAADTTVQSAAGPTANRVTGAAASVVTVGPTAAANAAAEDGNGTGPLPPQLQLQTKTVPQPPPSATLRPPSVPNPNPSNIACSNGGSNALSRLQQLQLQGAAELQFFMQLQEASRNDQGRFDAAAVAPPPIPNEQSVATAQRHTVPLELEERHLALLSRLNDAHKDLVASATAALAAAAEPTTGGAMTERGGTAGNGDDEAVAEAAAEARVLQSGLWEVEHMERLIASHQARHRSMQQQQQQQQQHQQRAGGQHVAIAPDRKALLQMYVAIMGLRQAAVALLHYGVRAAHMALALLVRQLPPVAKLCGGAAEVLEEVSKQVDEQLAGPITATTTAAASSPFGFSGDAAAGTGADDGVYGPLVDHPAVGAVHRLLTVLDATNPDPRVLIVTDPRVFFVFYPAVQAAGLRPAHLPAAVVKELSVASPSSAPAGTPRTSAVTTASSAAGGDKAGGSGCEAPAGDGQAAIMQEIMALAQRGTCLFVGHRLAAHSAGFPLNHFDALLILLPDRPGAWGGGGGEPPNLSAPGGGARRGGGGGPDATACDGWAGVPARLQEVAVERHLIFTRRPSDASLAAVVLKRRRSEMNGASEAVHCTEQSREHPRPCTQQLMLPRTSSQPPSLQSPELLQTRRTQEGISDDGLREDVVAKKDIQGRSTGSPGAEPSGDRLRSVPVAAPAHSQLQQLQQQSFELPLLQQAQTKQPERQQHQQDGAQEVHGPQGHLFHQQPQRQDGTQAPEMPMSCRIPGSEQKAGRNAAARHPHNPHELLPIRDVPFSTGPAAVASASATGCSATPLQPSDGDITGRWPVIFSSAQGSVLRTRSSLGDQLLKRCEVTHRAEVWWRPLDIADVVLSPVACVAVWPFTLPPQQPPPAQQGQSSRSSQLPAKMSLEEEQEFAELLLPVMLDRVLLLSMRYSRATVVFEAPGGLGAALLSRSAALQAAAMKAGLRLMLLTTVGQQATQNTVLSVVDAILQHDPSCRFGADNNGGSSSHVTDKRLRLPYAPLDEEPTAAEVLLCKTPCLNPLSAAALLATGLPLRNLLQAIITAASALTADAPDGPTDGGATVRLWGSNTVDGDAGAATGNRGRGNGPIGKATEGACRDGYEVNSLWRVRQALQYVPSTCVPLLSAHLVAVKQEHHRRRQQRQQEQDGKQQRTHAQQCQQQRSLVQQQGMVHGKHQDPQYQQQAPAQQQQQWPAPHPRPQQPPPAAREPQLEMQHMRQVGTKRQRLGLSTTCRAPAADEDSPWLRGAASERDHSDWSLPKDGLALKTPKSGHEPQARHNQHEQLQSSQRNPYQQQHEQSIYQPSQHHGSFTANHYDGPRAQQPLLHDCSLQHLQQQSYHQQQQQQQQHQEYQHQLDSQPQQQRLPIYAEGCAGGGSQLRRPRPQPQPPYSCEGERGPDQNLLDIQTEDELHYRLAGHATTSSGAQQAITDGPLSCARTGTLPQGGIHNPGASADRKVTISGNVHPYRGVAPADPRPGYVKRGMNDLGVDPEAPALELSVEEEHEAVRPSASSLMMLRNPLSYIPKGASESMRVGLGSRGGSDQRCFHPGLPNPNVGLDLREHLDPDAGMVSADFRTRPSVTPMPVPVGTGAVNTSSGLGGHKVLPSSLITNARPFHEFSTGAWESAPVGYVDRGSLDAQCLLDDFLAQNPTHVRGVGTATATSGRQRPRAAADSTDMAAAGMAGGGVFAGFAMPGSGGGGNGAIAAAAASGPTTGSSAAAQGRAAGGWQNGPAVLGVSVGSRKGGRGSWGGRTVGAGRGRRYNRR